MKILWLSPWMRPLARIYTEQLKERGHSCLLVTSDRHYEPVDPYAWERIIEPRPKNLQTWPVFLRVLREAIAFRPDIVVSELVQDPRWWIFGSLAPVVHLVHDDQPHDETEQQPSWRQVLDRAWGWRAKKELVFSHYVASRLHARGPAVVPLTSDLRDQDVPPWPKVRRDFVLIGRLAPYKNISIALRAWEAHQSSSHYRGDRFLIFGDGPGQWDDLKKLPQACEWRRGRFSYRQLISVLAAAKGSLVHYRQASQSGVQLLSMQLGVPTIVSDRGALPEFQPPETMPLDVDDVDGLAMWFSSMAEPAAADRAGKLAQRHYYKNYRASLSAQRLEDVLAEVVSPRSV